MQGSIGSATTGDTMQIRQVFNKGNPLYGLLSVSGTFSGTITFEVAPPGGTFVSYITPVVGTAAFSQAILIPADCDVRFNVTAFTSGSFGYYFGLPA